MADPYAEGMAAKQVGAPKDVCPYDCTKADQVSRYIAWMKGWEHVSRLQMRTSVPSKTT